MNPNAQPNPARRSALQTAAAMALGPGASAAQANTTAHANNTIPQPSEAMRKPLPALRTPGKPGDFDFLTGHWRISQQRKLPSGEWDFFDGEASVYAILAGICSIEELRIPARKFSGMGLRTLDVKKQLWSDYWMNASFGVMAAPPGLTGSFEGGAGIFDSDETTEGKRVLYRSVWDQISAGRCRWQQGVSKDDGKTWEVGWSMDWRKTADMAPLAG